ncbi:hypothetical protein GBA52_028651 [Prunus armeniaca]|nr:hypothetical protein GBA52_028651 [Prunus armeniaca]
MESEMSKQCCFTARIWVATLARVATSMQSLGRQSHGMMPCSQVHGTSNTKPTTFFTCNCHSFVANCLNRIFYGGSMSWNMINVAGLVLLKGQWVDAMSVLRSFLPFLLVLSLGVFMVGWPFLVALLSFSLLLVVWFLLANYCFKTLLEC